MKLAIVIPAYNEQATICTVINAIKLHEQSCVFNFDIVVVDDGSTDNTLVLLNQINGIVVLPLVTNLGAWKAMQTGIRYCYINGYDRIITFDADGQHSPNSIDSLVLSQNTNKNDVVIGSCPTRGSIARQVAWKLFRTLSQIKVSDLTSGLRIYNRPSLAILSSREATLLEYQDVGVLLLLKTFGLTFCEIEVNMNRRTDGISRIFHSWGAVSYYMFHTTLLCLSKVKLSNELAYQKALNKNNERA